ncbi:hypothetical protein Tco_0133551 [Tanacetum coccineum]
MAGSEDDIPPPPPPSQTPTQQTPHTVSTIKLPILKKGEYDIWAMKMEHYLAHTGGGPLPSAWSQVSLIMRTKPGVDSLSFDDLYNNLRVFESDVKGSTASSSSTQNVAFVSENTSSTNDLDEFDLEEMDLKMAECRSKGNQDSRRIDTWNTRNKDKENGRRSGKQEDSKALVTLDGEGVDWTSHSEDKQENYALMACSNSGSDTEDTREQLRNAQKTFSFSWKSWLPAISSPFLLNQTHQAVPDPHDPIVDNWIDLQVRSMMKYVHIVSYDQKS